MDINSLLSPSSQEAPQSTTPTPTPPIPVGSASHPAAVGPGASLSVSSPLSSASSLSHQPVQFHHPSNLTNDHHYQHYQQQQQQQQTQSHPFPARSQGIYRSQSTSSMSTASQLTQSPTHVRITDGKDGSNEIPPVPPRAGTTSPSPSASSRAVSNINSSNNTKPGAAPSQPLFPPPSSRIIPSRSSSRRHPSMDSGKEAEKKDGSEDSDLRRGSSRTNSSAEVVMKDPPPSPDRAPQELFEDSDDEDDQGDPLEVPENAASDKSEVLSEIDYLRIIELRDKFELSNVKDPSNPSTPPPTFAEHADCIRLLRRGYLATNRSPEYEFKSTLRDERERLLESYPMSTTMWKEWLDDEMATAKQLSDKVDVLELWTRSVSHEPASVNLWVGYIKFVLGMWKEGHMRAKSEEGDEENWADVFTHDMVGSVFNQAVKVTMCNVAESNRVWDKFILYQRVDLDPESPNMTKVDAVQQLYLARLQVPHMTLEDTFSAYSSFISTFKQSSYEQIMKDANKVVSTTKKALEPRIDFEIKLKRSKGSAEEGAAWAEYIKWETSSHKKKLDTNFCIALFERCALRYSMESRVWEEFVFFVLERCDMDTRILPILERATLHCQWSGTLWSQRILSLEKRFKGFDYIEKVKHKATESRLLTDREQLFKVHLAWCNFLKRMGVGKGVAVDEDTQDFAELGIRSALTEVGYMDTKFRMAQILITFLTLRGNKSGAREEWKKLVTLRSKEYEFWLQYYQWAMVHMDTHTALGVLMEALKHKDEMDWPEKIVDTYSLHVEDYGTAAEMEDALVKIWRIQKALTERREAEAQQYRETDAQAKSTTNSKETKGKRRRSSIYETLQPPQKKSRSGEEEEEEEDVEMKDGGNSEINNDDDSAQDKEQPSKAKDNKSKRDREKNTIIARNLPPEIDEQTVRRFFKDCGKINSFSMVVEENKESATATIEFDNDADVLAARTRDLKRIDDREIQVSIGLRTSVYVTNFPPTADSAWVNEFFKDCGKIVDVRFPSLKFNQHRRFCYVQFASAEEAQEACKRNGESVEDLSLVVSISDPSKKQDRQGAVYEGRELFVRNIDYKATSNDLKEFFGEKWNVESVRIPSNPKGEHKGWGFVTLASKEDAEEAVATMNDAKFMSRNLKLSIAEPTNAASKKHNLATAVDGGSASPAASAGSPPPMDEISQKTLNVIGVPDTVNDTKIRKLFEEYGEIRRVQLQPKHSGAIVEFINSTDAGKASLALEGHELEGGVLKFVTRRELFGTGAQVKEKKGANPFSKKQKMEQVFVPRRVQPLAAAGPKRRPGFVGKPSSISEENSAEAGGEKSDTNGSSTRTNDQFRELFITKK